MKTLPKPATVAELARFVGGRAFGDADLVLEGVSELSEATSKDIAFLGNLKYGAAAAVSPAGCLLLPPKAKDAPCAAKARIIVEDPQAAFAKILGLIDAARRGDLAATLSPKASIHPQAKLGPGVSVGDFTVIEKGAVIAEGTVIMPQCYVGEGARIGKNCLLYPQVVLREECELGDRVIVHAGTVIGADGFGFTTDKKTGRHTKIPQIGNAVVQDDVEIGAGVTIDRATVGSTVVGSGTKVDNLVQLAHNVRVGRDCFIVSQTGVAGSTTVGNNVILAGQAGVAGHISIGDGAVITAQTGVMSDVPARAVLFGSPGRPHREAFKLQALYGRLPELFDKIKEIEKKLGLGKTDAAL
ncbi:MAG TPA: UDP-3-O-(3-hydroxymyristoyl)glucosamine N-acyltransferase [Elusimicrobia bacterium]|nr:MAG: UDP-3-O-(3-hydroxymyristoyl)glucosamine N-acyltransferase [Elusimicrobia bacterium GWA2_66_18]HAZ07262.1 UDP-3-O-(3-hydroxymyristoyl)glucosamine N-acyltransferase [Elusimicrobiota bacterium]